MPNNCLVCLSSLFFLVSLAYFQSLSITVQDSLELEVGLNCVLSLKIPICRLCLICVNPEIRQTSLLSLKFTSFNLNAGIHCLN